MPLTEIASRLASVTSPSQGPPINSFLGFTRGFQFSDQISSESLQLQRTGPLPGIPDIRAAETRGTHHRMGLGKVHQPECVFRTEADDRRRVVRRDSVGSTAILLSQTRGQERRASERAARLGYGPAIAQAQLGTATKLGPRQCRRGLIP